MAKKINYYSAKNILSTDSVIMMLLGQRANGKSYQAKLTVLKDAFKNHKKFIYLRRWSLDIKQDDVSGYFNDMPIIEITEGKYVGVCAYRGYIYFYNVDEDDKIIRGECIGRYCALNINERYKSQVFEGYEWIIYEEFITDGLYLDDEPRKLMQFMSTVFRHRKGRVWLIGNTLTRVCPYFKEWDLRMVLKMKPGDLQICHYHVGDDTINLAVEYCQNANYNNTMFFGQAAKQIISGEWDTKDLPHLPGEQKDYELLYRVLVEYQDFKFCMNLLASIKTGDRLVFVYPLTSKLKVDRILTDRFEDNPLISSRLNMNRRAEAYIRDCFMLNKVCYSDNLTGTDFSHVNEHFKIAPLFI